MARTWTVGCLLSLFCLQSTAIAMSSGQDSVVDVYLIMGQSNAVGHGGPLDSAYDWHLRTVKDIAYASRRSSETWEPMLEPEMGWATTGAVSRDFLGLRVRKERRRAGYGVEMSLGKSLYYRSQDYKAKRKRLALIKIAVGATPLLEEYKSQRSDNVSWEKDLSDKSIEYLHSNLRELKIRHGYSAINVKGLLWIQGESDAAMSRHVNRNAIDEYAITLAAMIRKIQTRVSRLPYVSAGREMPVVMVGLNSKAQVWNSKYHAASGKLVSDVFNEKLVWLARRFDHYKYLPTHGYRMDNVHYHGVSLLRIGHKAAKLFLAVTP